MRSLFKYITTIICLAAIPQIYAQEKDNQLIFKQIIRNSPATNKGERLLFFAQQFIEKPYVAHTLEKPKETLVVNFQAFDCATFVETVVALTLIQDSSFASFQNQLQQLRYRYGKVNGYASRLHYFSDWLVTNERKGYIQNITLSCGGQPYNKDISYMSAHAQQYPALADYKSLEGIKMAEWDLKRVKLSYIPKNKLLSKESFIQTGDIIAITSSVGGLDIAHEGFAIRQNGRVYLLHASQDFGKVMVTKEPLVEYLSRHPKQTGVMISRLK